MIQLSGTELHRVRFALCIAVGVPVIVAAALNFHAFFSLVLFFVFLAMIVPGLDWIARHLRLGRGATAGVLALVYTFLLVIGAYTLLPLMIKGGLEAAATMSTFSTDSPKLFKEGWQWVREYLESWSFITPEMIDSAAKWVQEHVSAVVSPSATALAEVGKFLWRGTVSVATLVVMPYVMLFAYAWWSWEEEMCESIVHSFLPDPYSRVIVRWWIKMRDHGTTLFKAMGTSMLIFSVVFTFVLLMCRVIGYPISIPKAVFFGVVLGMTGGVPMIGGIINYLTIVIVGVANFGLKMIVVWLLGVTVVVHKLEISFVTPWVVGAKLKFSTIGLAMCFFIGFGLWGATILGIATSLLLMPWYRASKEIADEALHHPEQLTIVPDGEVVAADPAPGLLSAVA